MPSDKHFAAAFNIGTFGGQTAVGISQFLRASNNIVVSGCLALQDRQVGGRAGVMMASGEQERFVCHALNGFISTGTNEGAI